MFGFLALSYSRRWGDPDTIRGDLFLVIGFITAAQFIGILALLTGQKWAVADYGRFQGVFTNANYAAAMCVIGIAIAVSIWRTELGRSWWLLAATVVMTAALLLAGSRGAVIALGISLITLGLRAINRRILIVPILVAGATLALAVVVIPTLPPSFAGPFSRTAQASDITSGRIDIYDELLIRWVHSPWLGTGYRTTELLSSNHVLAGHDTYLSVLAETGLIGAVIFGSLLVLILRSGPTIGPGRYMLAMVVAVLSIELTESSLFGWGSSITLPEWLTLLGFAAAGRSWRQAVTTHGGAEQPTLDSSDVA
jgi:O-antigen ligase